MSVGIYTATHVTVTVLDSNAVSELLPRPVLESMCKARTM